MGLQHGQPGHDHELSRRKRHVGGLVSNSYYSHLALGQATFPGITYTQSTYGAVGRVVSRASGLGVIAVIDWLGITTESAAQMVFSRAVADRPVSAASIDTGEHQAMLFAVAVEPTDTRED